VKKFYFLLRQKIMQIIWKGQSFFQIIARHNNGRITIAIDPFSEDIGLKIPSIEADITLITHYHQDHANVKAIKGQPFSIESPGEYEVKGVFIQGIDSFHDNVKGKKRGKNTIYLIEVEDIKICHLGDIGQKELTDDQVEKISQVDILMIPIGGVFTISAEEAVKIISQLEPKLVIPMHYKIPKLNIKLDGPEKFLKRMGVRSPETSDKLLIKRKDLPDETKIIILKP